MRLEVGFLLAALGVLLEEIFVRKGTTLRYNPLLRGLSLLIVEMVAKGTLLVALLGRFHDNEPLLFSLLTTYLWQSLSIIACLTVIFRIRLSDKPRNMANNVG